LNVGARLRLLNQVYPGDTYPYSDLAHLITENSLSSTQFAFKFHADMSQILHRQILIGSFTDMHRIQEATLTFHDDEGQLMQSLYGNPMQYKSNLHDLGHILDVSYHEERFSYAMCTLHIDSHTDFDRHQLYFHFPQPEIPRNSKTRDDG
jgi:hypothetical protein